ncbi:unnamed protein product [Ixodes persulcatus]
MLKLRDFIERYQYRRVHLSLVRQFLVGKARCTSKPNIVTIRLKKSALMATTYPNIPIMLSPVGRHTVTFPLSQHAQTTTCMQLTFGRHDLQRNAHLRSGALRADTRSRFV